MNVRVAVRIQNMMLLLCPLAGLMVLIGAEVGSWQPTEFHSCRGKELLGNLILYHVLGVLEYHY